MSSYRSTCYSSNLAKYTYALFNSLFEVAIYVPFIITGSSTSCNDTAVVDQIYNITRSYTTMRAYFHQNFQVGNGEGIQLRFIQFKHGGGYCDCWGLACDLLLINSSGNIVKSM